MLGAFCFACCTLIGILPSIRLALPLNALKELAAITSASVGSDLAFCNVLIEFADNELVDVNVLFV